MKTLLGLTFLSLLGIFTAQTESFPEDNPSLPVSPAVTNVTTSQCDAENRCTCVVQAPEPCPADVVYAELVEARRQLDIVYSHLRGEQVTNIRTSMDRLVARVRTLETSIHNQSISLSMSEISSIQDQVILMQSALESFTLSQNSTVIEQLHGEVAAIRQALIRLGTKNPIAVHDDLSREINRLRSRLESCATIAKEHGESELDFIGDGLPANHTINRGMCPPSNNLSVGAPVTYKFRSGITGIWLKDPLPVSEVEKTKIYEMRSHYYPSSIRQYLYSYEDLLTYERTDSDARAIQSTCQVRSYGQKLLYLNGFLYWFDGNRVNKLDVFNAQSCTANVVSSPFTLTNTGADYIGSDHNDGDLNFDETGLYIVFADDDGDLSIRKLNPDTLEVEDRWDTGKSKRLIANVFMVCGRLYSTDDYTSRHLTGLQWGYDTNTREEFHYDINVESKYGNLQALSYNPRERALFGWDNGHPVLYHVFF